jgi:replicative DNA helicase
MSDAIPDADPIADRVLPQSVEAEQFVLGALLLDPSSVAPSLLSLLSEKDFYSTRHQRIFFAIRELYDELSRVDSILVRDKLEERGESDGAGGLEYLRELIDCVTTVANAEYHGRRVKDKAVLRHLITTCTEIVRNAYESDEPAPVQLDQAEQRILDIGHSGSASDFIEIQKVIDAHFDQFDQGNLAGVPTGFKELDEITTGLRPAELIVVAGRPSMGKTSLCMNIVDTVAGAGKTVAVFSLEVSREQLVQNLLCSFSRVNAQECRKNTLSPAQWNALIEGAARLREYRIFIDDSPGLTPLAMKAKARRLHARHHLDLVVIDYLQLMEGGDSSGDNRQQEVSKISRSLKSLARELNVPVIAISQLSRGVENRESHRPRLSDLRESGAIEQDADLVLLLYREEYYYPDRDECKGKTEVIVAKQRNGPTGKVELAFISPYMRFENLARHAEVY